MTPDTYAQASELVARLLELDTAAWADELARVSSSAPELARAARELLECMETSEGFLSESPITDGLMALAKDPFGLIGKTLDDTYVVESLIGQGGVGAVYKARHRLLPRDFAIKVIPRSVRDRVSIEGAAGALIQSPAVVAITDYKILPSGDLYLAMEFIPGESLRETMRRHGRIGLREALDIVAQVASALDAAHEAGFVHRDIKPENILLSSTGDAASRVRVIDFGIAGYEPSPRDLEEPTLTGIGIGTPAYMSPEQWNDDPETPHPITARSDVYSLAVVFFEMIAGERPVMAVGTELQRDVLGGKHSRLDDYAPELPARIREAVARALSVDPADRHASAGDFIAELIGGAHPPERSTTDLASVPASLTLIDRIEIPTRNGSASLEFYRGDLMAMPPDWSVDFLVVSLFRDDYIPTSGSLLEALSRDGLPLGRLASEKELDLRDRCSCWLSRPIAEIDGRFPFRRVIGFEPEGIHTPADKIDDLFKFLLVVIDDDDDSVTVAMPLLGTGGKAGLVKNLLPPLVGRAAHWIRAGLNIGRIVVIERDPGRADDLRRELRKVKQALQPAAWMLEDRGVLDHLALGARPVRTDAGTSVHRLDLIDGHLYIDLDGRSYLLDTGAPISFGAGASVEIGGIRHSISPSYAGLTGESISAFVGRPTAGIVGADLMNRFDVLLDVPSGRVTFSTGELELAGDRIAMEDFTGIPIVTAVVGGARRRMFFDTGAQFSYLEHSTLSTCPPMGVVTDFYPGLGQFETETYAVEVALASEKRTIRCGTLPPILGMTLAVAGADGIIGNEIVRERVAGYFPRRRVLVLG